MYVIKVFSSGRASKDNTVTSIFGQAVYATCIRISPKTWTTIIALRFDVLGCLGKGQMLLDA